MPGASLIQIAATDQRPLTSGVSPRIGIPSGVSDSRPLIACRMPTLSSPRMSGTSSRACSIWSSKSSWVNGSSVGDSAAAAIEGISSGSMQDRPVGVRADLEVAAVLALVHVRVHVADDRELDLADRVGELRHGPDADHLVDGRRERDRAPAIRGDARAPARRRR